MNKKICIMDVELNILDNKQLEEQVREYLENDYLNVILLASEKLLLYAAENPEFREKLLRADLILPGEEELLGMYHGQVLKEGGMIVSYRCLERLLRAFCREQKTVYTVYDNEHYIRFIENAFRNFQSGAILAGSAMEQEMTDESIVNEINSLAPDVLLIAMEVPKQEEWMMAHSAQLNSKLCLGLGGIMDQMITEYKAEPAIISKLHLSGIYNALVRQNHYKKARKEKFFRQKLKEYRKEKRGNNDENTSK